MGRLGRLCSSISLSFLYTAAAAPFDETLQAQGLLGSHFGVPGQPNGVPQTFDYVVVGGGTAGLTLATRLAENGSNSVAVVEAGGFYELDNGDISSIPADDVYFSGSSPLDTQPLIDWSVVTVPQVGLGGRKMHYAQGKTLGGGSARNYMAFHRSTIGAFQKWADEVGDRSYTFEQLLPYFQKSVKFTPPRTDLRIPNATVSCNASAFSPTGGPLHASFSNWANSFSTWVRLGLKSVGIGDAYDFQSGTLMGGQFVPNTINPDDEARSSSETSFLRQAILNEDSLIVFKSALAKKVLFGSSKNAMGVQVDSAGLTYNLYANMEVILSAGAFRSPQLLMVSGIGPRATLQKYGIPILSELEGVGQNMWDHIAFGPAYRVNLVTHSQLGHDFAFGAQSAAEYNSQPPTGILTNTGGDFLAFEKLPENIRCEELSRDSQDALACFPSDWPELEYLFLDAYAGLQQNYILGGPHNDYNYGSAVAALVAPLSRGTVTINSTDTSDNPVVNPNWLTHPTDVQLAVAAFKRARTIFTSGAMSPILVGAEAFPGPAIQTDAQILTTIKASLNTLYHASATCKMGRAGDPMAVVDSHARVLGVSGLRVVDASMFPFLPPGHPQSLVYALAEKIADLIKRGE